MTNQIEIGTPPWTRDQVKEAIPEFLEVFQRRPIRDNKGGMGAPHMFAAWFITRAINPKFIVESGIWRGQSTWLLEQSCPNATIVSIDIDLSRRTYISKNATYYSNDFSTIDWSAHERDDSLVFFDDHQNAMERLNQCRELGFNRLIFEDNYPALRGDCYSLKKVFAESGYQPERSTGLLGGTVRKLRETLRPELRQVEVPPNQDDARRSRQLLETYYEFPPVYQSEVTRWGDAWRAPAYPTPEPLFANDEKALWPVFWDDVVQYTWICYAQLKKL